MTTLLTGWTGLVGRHTLRALERAGVGSIRLLSRSNPTADPRAICVDLACRAAVSEADLSDVRQVIHCAASTPATSEDHTASNVQGLRHLLDELPLEQLESFVLASSLSVYATDDISVGAPTRGEGYGGTKRAQECLIESLPETVATAIFRISSVYGAGMHRSTVLPIFCDRAAQHMPLRITAPDYAQNFIWAGDVATVFVLASQTRLDGTFNLFSDTTLDLWSIAEHAIRATSSTSHVSPSRPIDLASDERFVPFDASLTPGFSGFHSLESTISEVLV